MSRASGHRAIGLGLIKQSTANLLDVAQQLRGELVELNKVLPDGMLTLTPAPNTAGSGAGNVRLDVMNQLLDRVSNQLLADNRRALLGAGDGCVLCALVRRARDGAAERIAQNEDGVAMRTISWIALFGMSSACSLTSSCDQRSKANSIDARSRSRNRGLMSVSKLAGCVDPDVIEGHNIFRFDLDPPSMHQALAAAYSKQLA